MSKSEQDLEAETIKEYDLLVNSLAPSNTAQDHLTQGGAAHSGLSLPTLINNQDNLPQITLISAVPQLRLSSPGIQAVVLEIETLMPG